MIVSKNNKRISAALLAALMLASCSPKVQKREFPEANHNFTTRQQDVQLDLKEISANELIKKLSANQELKTGELFRSVSGLNALSKQYGKPALKSLAQGINTQFYSSFNTTAKIRFEDSPLIQAILGVGQNYFTLAKQLIAVLESAPKNYKASKDFKLSGFGDETMKLLTWILDEAEKAGLDAEIVAAAKQNLGKEISPILNDGLQAGINEALAAIDAGTTATDKMNAVSSLTDALQLDLLNDSSLSAMSKFIEKSNALALKIDAIVDQASAQTVLTEAVAALPKAEVAKLDKTAKSEETKKALTSLLQTNVLAKVTGAAAQISLHKMPRTLAIVGIAQKFEMDEDVAAQLFEKGYALLKDPEAGMKQIAANFSQLQLKQAPAGISAIETDKITLSVDSNNMKMSGSAKKEIKTSAEALGASLSNSIAQIAEADEQNLSDKEETKALVVSQLNKLVLISGFKVGDKSVSYTTIQDGNSTPLSALDPDAPATDKVAAVSDEITISKSLEPASTESAAAKSVSVRGQAALLKGLSDVIAYLRDWVPNGFDNGLGKITVGQLIGVEADHKLLQTKVFDKSTMFAFAIKNAATILQNTKKEGTPFFLMGGGADPIWINEHVENDGCSRATAGIVDIINGKRSDVTKTGDLARYMLAVTTFLRSTEDIDKTSSALLKAENSDTGVAPIKELTEARASLTTLLTALANMLSHNLEQSSGLFASEFNMKSLKASGQASAVDSALAIQALVEARDVLQADVYKLSALDAFYAMNKNLFRKDIQFYSQDAEKKKAPSYDELISILSSINTLAPHMTEESKAQWNTIATNWVAALETLANNLEAAKK